MKLDLIEYVSSILIISATNEMTAAVTEPDIDRAHVHRSLFRKVAYARLHVCLCHLCPL